MAVDGKNGIWKFGGFGRFLGGGSMRKTKKTGGNCKNSGFVGRTIFIR